MPEVWGLYHTEFKLLSRRAGEEARAEVSGMSHNEHQERASSPPYCKGNCGNFFGYAVHAPTLVVSTGAGLDCRFRVGDRQAARPVF